MSSLSQTPSSAPRARDLRTIAWVAAGLLAWAGPAESTAETAPPALGLWGDHGMLWAHQHHDTPEGLRLTLAFRPVSGPTFIAPARFRDLSGILIAAEAVGPHLHVFYEGAHRRYSLVGPEIRDFTEIPLPQDAIPTVLAGDPAGKVLYGVVGRDTALAIEAARIQRFELEHAGRDEKDTPEPPAPFDVGSAGQLLAAYDKGHWYVATEVPADCETNEDAVALVDGDGRVQLLCISGSTWNYTTLLSDTTDEVRSQSMEAGFEPLILFERVSGVSVLGYRQESGGPRLSVSRFDAGRWSAERPLEVPEWPSNDKVTELVAARTFEGFTVAIADANHKAWYSMCPPPKPPGPRRPADRVATESSSDDPAGDAVIPPPTAATATTELKQFGPWVELRTLRGRTRGNLDAETQSFLAFAVLAAMLGFVFWRRHDSITRELELPAHYRPAGYGRRLSAFVLDALPAALLTFQAWWPPLHRWQQNYLIKELEEGRSPGMSLDVVVGWLVACTVYLLYCGVCEAWFGTTPGKAAVQCRAVSESGHRMEFKQVVLRNLLRGVELFPMFQLFPPVILILFTRNRQRLGDLVARTVVVETVHPERQRAAPSTSDQPAGDNKTPNE